MRYLTLLFLAMLCSGTTLAQLATPDESGIAYGHMHLNVSSIDQHLPIWTEHFGGEEIAIGPLRAVKFPNMIVMFAEQTPAMGSRETVMDHFGFKVRNIQRFIDKWEAAGFEMGRVFTGAEGQINAYVTLPDGVYVELQEDQGLREEFTGYHVHYFTSQYEELLDKSNDYQCTRLQSEFRQFKFTPRSNPRHSNRPRRFRDLQPGRFLPQLGRARH